MPAMLSNAAFLTAVQAMTVTGVTKHFDNPPASLNTADLPAAFPLWPGANFLDMPTSCKNTGKTRTIGFVIAVEASGQGTYALNYGKFASLMDNLESSIDTAFTSAANFYTYEMSTIPNYPVGDNTYWSIVVTITISATLGG